MKQASIMEVQHHFSRVLGSLGPRDRLMITRNRKVVAELRLAESAAAPEFPDFVARARASWGGEWKASSTDALLAESRGDR